MVDVPTKEEFDALILRIVTLEQQIVALPEPISQEVKAALLVVLNWLGAELNK